MSVRKKIEEIMNSNKGKVFILKDFAHLGCKNTVKSAMLRLCNSGKVDRVLKGVYVIKEYSEFFKQKVPVDIKQVVEKYIERFGGKVSETGVAATNITGACTQVAAKYAYAIDRKVREKKLVIEEKITVRLIPMNKHYFVNSKAGNLLIQAMMDFGRKGKVYFKNLTRFVKENKEELEKENFDNLPFAWLRQGIKKLLI